MKRYPTLSTVWAVNGVLLVLLLLSWLTLSSWQAPAPRKPDYESVLADARLPGELNAADYPAITEAPLFEADRKWPQPAPPPPAPAPVASPPPPPPADPLASAIISGIFEIGGQGIVLLEKDGVFHRLQIGQSFDGWELHSIDHLKVEFTHPGLPPRKLELLRPGDVGFNRHAAGKPPAK